MTGDKVYTLFRFKQNSDLARQAVDVTVVLEGTLIDPDSGLVDFDRVLGRVEEGPTLVRRNLPGNHVVPLGLPRGDEARKYVRYSDSLVHWTDPIETGSLRDRIIDMYKSRN